MTTESREELIGAYVDGELSEEERAKVEAWLAESAELRQLRDELVAVKSSMQALPRHKLSHDLVPEILRRAELEVLRDRPQVEESNPIAGVIRPAETTTSWWARGTGWRRMIWPAVALAASLVILFFDVGKKADEQQVAMAPKDGGKTELRSAPAEGYAAPAAEAPALDAAGGSQSVSNRADESLIRGAQKQGEPQTQPNAADRYQTQTPAGRVIRIERDAKNAQPQLMDAASEGAPAASRAVNAPKPILAEPSEQESQGMPANGGESKAKLAAPNAPLSKGEVQLAAEATDLVFEVNPQYLATNRFEEVLKTKQVKWQRQAGPIGKDTHLYAQSAQTQNLQSQIQQDPALASAPRITYTIQADAALRDELVAELSRQSEVGKKSQVRSRAFFNTAKEMAKQAGGSGTEGFRITLWAPGNATQAPAAATPVPASAPAQQAPAALPAKP